MVVERKVHHCVDILDVWGTGRGHRRWGLCIREAASTVVQVVGFDKEMTEK
jgi:hypothetical protein